MGGGVHGGSGGHPGGMGGSFHGGFAGAPHGGGYWGGGFHGGYWRGPGHFPYYPGRYPYYGWRYPGWGYRGYYGYGGYGYPWWGWSGGVGWSSGYYPSGWYSDPATQYPVYAYANPDNTNTAAYNQQQEIDRLNDEVARLRVEQQVSSAGTSVPRPPPQAEVRGDTVLVFRDHHSEEIENYAIVGRTLWVFTEQRARKIPIAELNVPATTKANEARGIDFRLPGQ
jgi:hypothetical protein